MTEGNKNYTETEIMLGALDRVIREEMKKRPSKRDNKLIDECIVEMAKLKNVRTGYTEEEIDAIVEQIEAKAAKKTERVPVRRKSVRRMAAVVCAACLIMGCGVAAVAWNPFDCVKDWISEIMDKPSGTVREQEGVTYINHADSTYYESIETLLEQEGINICYPTVLPNQVRITELEQMVVQGQELISIYFNDSTLDYTVQFNTPLYLNNTDYEIVEKNGVVFYISYLNNRYTARWYIDSNLYLIECADYQNILLIINNLEF